MRKTAVLISAAVILSGCSAKGISDRPKAVAEHFSVRAEVTDGDFTCEADMERTAEGWKAVITSPDTVKGTEFTIDGEQVHIRYGELGLSTAHGDFPDGSPIRLTAAVLDRCVGKHTEGEIYGQHYVAEIKDGVPEQLTVGTGFMVKLSKFKKSEK